MSPIASALRGHIYRVLVKPDAAMLALVVSNNSFNRRGRAVTVLVTADPNVPAGMPSWVPLRAGDSAFGHVVVSHFGWVATSELKEDIGELSAETLMRVEAALRLTLGL